MRTTAERRGAPDRSRAGNFRIEGHPSRRRPTDPTNPRRGYPDRTRVGTARQLDLRAETRNRLIRQIGDIGGGGVSTWLDLLDTPVSFGFAGQKVVVNDAADGLKFLIELVTADAILADGTVPMEADFNMGGFGFTDWPLNPQAITFTKTGVFAYRHERGASPCVQVLDSNGAQLEVCVRHTDADTVVLTFDGTLTNAVLVLT